MASFANQFLNQLGTGDEIKDYTHASKTFVDSLYRLGPKSTALFHVFIDVNPNIANIDSTKQVEIGLMAKTATLPKFTVQNKTLNAYNRKNIVQERVSYDPITLTFHDDSANIVRNFWYDYYQYYYRDADYQESLYQQGHKYQQRQTQEWGYSPKTDNGSENYINSIRIYSLHQKQFSSYILIRPTITNFSHGQHTQGDYSLLEHQMTLSYEAVQYEYGAVSNGTVKGFNVVHYDNSPSPLSTVGGGTTSFLGPGGLVENASDVVHNLQDGNYGAALLGSLRSYNNFKNANIKQVAAAELKQLGMTILRGQNTQSTLFVPTASSIQEGLAKAVHSIPGLVGATRTTHGNMNSQADQVPPTNAGRIDN